MSPVSSAESEVKPTCDVTEVTPLLLCSSWNSGKRLLGGLNRYVFRPGGQNRVILSEHKRIVVW